MKIRELQRQKLKEGFLDNLISKVKDMAGGDGPTGIVRSLMGQAPNLNKLADEIANNARSKILTRLGNQINAIKNGTAPTPIGLIFQQALAVAGNIANGEEGVKFNPAQIKATISSKGNELLKIVLNGDAASDDTVTQVYNAIQSGTPEITLANDINVTIKTVGMIVAAALVYISTQAEDNPGAGFKIDPTLLSKFNNSGEQIITTLVNPTSPVLRSLKPTPQYKDNLENLIANLVNELMEFTDKSVEEIQAAGVSPKLVSLAQIETALGGHDINVDVAVVKDAARKLNLQITNLTKAFLSSAALEAQATGSADRSWQQLVKPWGQKIMTSLDNLNLAGGKPGDAPTTTPPEVEDTFKKADEAGDAARSALRKNAGESNEDFIARGYAESDRARTEYLKANPTP